MVSVGALRAHLLAARLAGQVATSREESLRSYRRFAQRDPRVLVGLEPGRQWTVGALLRLMADRCGVSPDPGYRAGPEVIDPNRTMEGLDAFAERIGRVAREGRPVLLGTGHPQRLLGFYAVLAGALSASGCRVLTPGYGRRVGVPGRFGLRQCTLDYVHGVAVLRVEGTQPGGGAVGEHSHSPLPVRMALSAAQAVGGPLPGLVVGDHGWVCGAGQMGFPVIGLGDVDDPAPYVGQAEGRVEVVVPVDDAARPDYYGPLTRYVLERARLSG